MIYLTIKRTAKLPVNQILARDQRLRAFFLWKRLGLGYLQSEGVCSDANFLTGLRRPVKKLASEQTPSD